MFYHWIEVVIIMITLILNVPLIKKQMNFYKTLKNYNSNYQTKNFKQSTNQLFKVKIMNNYMYFLPTNQS